MDKEKVYIKLNKKAIIDIDDSVYTRDLGEVFCSKPELQKNIEKVKIKKGSADEDWGFATSILVTEKVLGKYPNIDLEILGEAEVLLEFKSQEKKSQFMQFFKVVLVCIILFFGSGFAIVNFHEDVDIAKSIKKLYFTFTGIKKDNPLIMTIPYSIGIGVGVITFFNRIFSSSKRRRMEPGPMEIELFLYDQDMENVISNEVRNDQGDK